MTGRSTTFDNYSWRDLPDPFIQVLEVGEFRAKDGSGPERDSFVISSNSEMIVCGRVRGSRQ
jgi:hypothetical protein